MVAKIHNTGKKAYFVYRYLISKVQNNLGEVLINNTAISFNNLTPFAINDYFLNNIKLNDKAKNSYVHISLNFPHFEFISNDKLKKIIHEYLHGLGYKDCSFIAIKHNDAHPHVHLIVSTVNHLGESISTSNNYKRSFNICRTIEQKYNLTPLPEVNLMKFSLNEKNRSSFFFRNSIAKILLSDNEHSKVLKNLLGKKNSDIFRFNKNVTNLQAISILGENMYNDILNYLYKNKLLFPSMKNLLIEKLDTILKNSKTFDDYIKQLKFHDIYFRILNKNGLSYIIYGFEDSNFFFKESFLPNKFKYSTLANRLGMPNPNIFSKSYIKQKVYEDFYNSLSNTFNIKELIANLNSKGYDVSIKKIDKKSRLVFNVPGTDYVFYDNDLTKHFRLERLIAHDIRNIFWDCKHNSTSFMDLTMKLRNKGLDFYFNSQKRTAFVRDIQRNVLVPLDFISKNLNLDILRKSFDKKAAYEFKYNTLYPLRYASFNPSKNSNFKLNKSNDKPFHI